MSLTDDAKARKAIPIATGFIDYFPDAIAAIAELSRIGNDQHNPGAPLHWDRSKSGDESDALMRHFVERGTIDTDGVRHSTKVAWRALALLQKELEAASRSERILDQLTSKESTPYANRRRRGPAARFRALLLATHPITDCPCDACDVLRREIDTQNELVAAASPTSERNAYGALGATHPANKL